MYAKGKNVLPCPEVSRQLKIFLRVSLLFTFQELREASPALKEILDKVDSEVPRLN